MGKDIKKRFTVSLNIDTKDAEKQIKATVGNIKTILTDMGNASDKMGYFKELVDYIQQVDSELTAFKKKNSDAFDNMFNGLDENLKQVMANIFNTTGESMSALDELRNKINVAGKNGAGVKELRNMAEEINSLFAGLGKIEPIDIDENFTGRGNLENRIKILTDSLDDFATVWSNVNNKIKNGFTIGGSAAGEIIPSGSDDVQKKISALESNIEKYNKILKDIKAGYKAYEDFADGKTVKLDFKPTIDGAKELVKAFMEVKSQLDATEEGTIEYYESLSKFTKLASQIAPMQEKLINEGFARKERDKIFDGVDLGFIDNIFNSDPKKTDPKKNLINNAKATIKSIISETQKEIDKLQSAPKNISGNKEGDQIKTIISYDKLSDKLKEYLNLKNKASDAHDSDDGSEESKDKIKALENEIETFENYFDALGKTEEEIGKIQGIIDNFTFGDIELNEALDQLCNILGVDIPKVIGTAQTEIESFTNDAKNNFNSLTNSIKDTFNYALQIETDTRNGKSTGKELMNLFSEDGSVSTTQGTDYQVDTDTLVQQAIANLNKNIIMSLHNHPNGDMSFSPSDINSFAKFYYGQGTKINGIIANGIVQTIDFSDISQEVAIKIAQDYQDGINKMFSAENIAQFASIKDGSIVPTELLNQIQSKDIKKYEEIISELQDAQTITLRQAFEQNGAEFTLKAFNLDNIKELTSYLLDVQQNGQNAIEPVEKLKNLISAIKPEVDLSQFTEVFDKFKNGAIDGTRALNQILDFKTVASDASVVTASIDQIETKVKEFLALTNKINDEWFYTSEDNVEIGKYIERLNSAKSELDALGDQGKLTAEQLQQVNNAFDFASSHLEGSVSRYTGYGSGEYVYSYLADYEAEQERADRLESENQELREQLSKQYDNTLSDMYDSASESVQGLIDKLIVLGNKRQEFQQKSQGVKLENYDVLNITDDQKEYILQTFEEYKRVQKAINDMPLIETDNDKQRLRELQIELISLGNTLKKTYLNDSIPEDYVRKFGLNIKDATELRNISSPYNTDLSKLRDQIDDEISEEYSDTFKLLSDSYKQFTDRMINNDEEWATLKKQRLQEIINMQHGVETVPIQSQNDQESTINNTPLQPNDNVNESKEIQDLEALRVKLIEVKEAINDKTDAFKEEGSVATNIVNEETQALQLLLVHLQEILTQINLISENFTKVNAEITELNNVKNVDNKEDITSGTVAEKASETISQNYALDSTLLTTNGILENILMAIGNNESFAQLIDPLNAAVTELKNVANGIVEHQKKQKTDYTAASSKISNNYGQLSSIATNAVSSLGDEVQIKQMKSLADDVVRVEGAVKNADGVWKGFIVDINESNNAVIHAIDEQSTFAKTLNETAESAKKVVKEAGPQDKFTQSLSAQKSAFNEYRKSLEDVDYLNDELIDGLEELAIRLQSISNTDGLEDWKDDFGTLKDEISVIQGVFNKIETEKIKEIRGKLNSEFKTLDFTTTTSDPTNEQQEILDLRKQLLTELEKSKEAIKDGKEVEISSLNEIMSALRQKISLYREANDLESGSRQKFGSTATLNATAKYNSLKQQANSGEFASSSVVQQAFQQYEEAYNRLIAKRKELSKVEGELTDTQKSEFKQLQTECNDYAKILNKIITDSKKLEANSVSRELLGEDFDDSMDGRKAALKDFVEETYGASATIGEFKDNFNKLTFTVDNGDGTFTEMTATINTARTAIDATAGTAKKATTAFESFFNELKGKFKSISAYLISSFSIQEVWQQIRRGVEYVREIDSALTELKKVTDETDETYQKFLQTMSNVAGVVGSTTSELTQSASDWARLGYSIEEAGELAKNTAILMNVSEFDNVNDATEALISSLQAFGYEASNSIEIVDKLNIVGKIVA